MYQNFKLQFTPYVPGVTLVLGVTTGSTRMDKSGDMSKSNNWASTYASMMLSAYTPTAMMMLKSRYRRK